MFGRKNSIEEKIEQHRFSMEIGHSKSGSDHILIIKSLKVRGDNMDELLNELKLALDDFKVLERR